MRLCAHTEFSTIPANCGLSTVRIYAVLCSSRSFHSMLALEWDSHMIVGFACCHLTWGPSEVITPAIGGHPVRHRAPLVTRPACGCAPFPNANWLAQHTDQQKEALFFFQTAGHPDITNAVQTMLTNFCHGWRVYTVACRFFSHTGSLDVG